MSTPLLTAENLFCERDERVLFDALSFTVNAGDVLQVEGPNGSGKTTLLRILAGLNSAFEGELSWQGQPMKAVKDGFLASLLYLGHLPAVKAILTPEENLRWFGALHPHIDIDDSAIAAALNAVGLYGYEDVPCHSLSAGQHRRVSLARLYLSRAPLWILDEPFTAIDKEGVAKQESLLEQHAAAGGAVIFTTHHDPKIANLKRLSLQAAATDTLREVGAASV